MMIRWRLPRGTTWNAVRVVVAQGSILARLLIVAAFIPSRELGLYALAGSVLAAAAALAEAGVRQQYMVQTADEHTNQLLALWTAWATNAFTKTVMLALAAGAGLIAMKIYGDSTIFWLVLASSAAMLVTSLANPELLRIERNRQFRPIALVDIGAQTTGLLATVWVVMQSHSVWAIVIGAGVASLLGLLISYLFLPCPARLAPSWRMVWQMAASGRHFSVIAVATFMTASLDKLLLGLFAPPSQLGIYFLAQRIGEAPMRFITEVTSRPLLVHYAKLRDEAGDTTLAREERTHARLFAGGAALAMLLMTGLVLLAVASHLKPGWREALPLILVFLLAYGMRAACQIPAMAMLAMQQVHVDARYKVQESVAMVPALLAGCALAGSWGAALVFLLVYVISFLRRHQFVKHHALAS